MYQNVNFLKRLISDIFDFAIYILILVLWIYLFNLINNKETINFFNYYFPIFSIIIWSNIYYCLFPILTKGKLISNYLFKTKIIDDKEKEFRWNIMLKRNITNSFFITFICLFLILFIYPSDFDGLKLVDSFKTNITYRLITIFITFFTFIKIFNYILLIFWKRRLSLVDFLTNTRVVFNNKIEPIIENICELKPFEKKWRKITKASNKEI